MTWKKLLAAAAALGAVCSMSVFSAPAQSEIGALFSAQLGERDLAYMFLGYSGVIVRTKAAAVVIDPANLLMDADVAELAKHKIDAILYTHGHGDHFNIVAARDLMGKTGAPVIAESSLAKILRNAEGIPADRVFVPTNGEPIKAGAAVVRSIAGKHVGPIRLFLVRLGEVTIFHGGDSAYVPLPGFQAQVAFLPTGDPSPTASPQSALKMAVAVKPQVVVVFHGSDAQHTEFQRLAKARLPGVRVEIPEHNKVKIIHLH